MILFAFPEFECTAAGLRVSVPRLTAGKFRSNRFDNGELWIQLETPVAGEDCAILGSFTPPDANILANLLLAHTLRKEGAKRITGILPYLAYSRQDKDKPRESLAAAWTGALARASGLDRVITVDAHSSEDERLFGIPLISLSPAASFAAALHGYQLAGATIIAPDWGAVARCEALRAAAGLPPAPVPWFEKHRAQDGIRHTSFDGEVGTQAVLVDDILDTGATLVSACQRLLCAGVEDIQIMVTHGLFTGTEWEELWSLGVSRIFRADTVPVRVGADHARDDARIVTLSATPLLAEALAD
ncbi:MAG: ribose-phosphate diphosphokinase [Bryobacteraceae bacterium]|jgi:ribose-phosphate pyrophosphokinase